MIAWGSQKGLMPPEPKTRATRPAPQGSHTTTQEDTHNTHKTWRQNREAVGRDISKGKELKLSGCSQERVFGCGPQEPLKCPLNLGCC